MTCFQAALVTGGSRGIDAASAVRLAASGAIVVTSDDRPVAEPLRREMSDAYGLAQIGCDASGYEQCAAEHLLDVEAE